MSTKDSPNGEWLLRALPPRAWRTVEELTEIALASEGLKADVTGLGADEGIDLHVVSKKWGAIPVQVKHQGQPVGRPDVQRFVGAALALPAEHGIFYSTSGFRKNVVEWTEKLSKFDLVLWDSQRLGKLLDRVPPFIVAQMVARYVPSLAKEWQDEQKKSNWYKDFKFREDRPRLDKEPKPDADACPRCSYGVLVSRRGRYGRFLGCTNYPECTFTKKSRLT